MLLMFPVFWATIVYALFIPRLELAWYKLPLVLLVLFLCLALSVRIKGKVAINWLVIILRYNVRPKYYVFDKNDAFLRTLDLPVFEKKQRSAFGKTASKEQAKKKAPDFSIADLVRFEGLLTDPKFSFSFKSSRKGGLYVAFEKDQK